MKVKGENILNDDSLLISSLLEYIKAITSVREKLLSL
jgi:hypothetical protein